MRNSLTVVAVIAIIAAAGAIYFLNHNRSAPPGNASAPTAAPSANTATNTPPTESGQAAGQSAPTQSTTTEATPPSTTTPGTSGSNTTTSSAGAATSTASGAGTEPTPPSTPPQTGSETTTSETATTSGAATSGSAESTNPSTAPQTAVIPPPEIGRVEHVLGKADAPVTVIEYASMTCPHCAKWDAEVMPRIKSEFIDKGLVRFVFRPFPLDGLAARASLLAQCTTGDGYFKLIEALFRSQSEWARASDPLAALKQIGRTAGIAEADIERCMADQAALDRIVAGIKEAQAKFGVDSTPSFVINGKKYTNMPFDDYQDQGTTKPGFAKVIKDLLPKS